METECLAEPAIYLSGLSRQFGDGEHAVHALREVELEVATGEYVSIVGPSGSGKSTLLNVLGLLDRPTEGTYRLAGRDTSHLTERERTALRGNEVGFVFQSFHLLNTRTAAENVALAEIYTGARRAGRLDRAHLLLDRVGLAHRAGFLPSKMSGGERQRVAIARAISGDPSLLLCDEPTGNLDSETSDEVLALFQDLNKEGLTIALITHDQDVAARAMRTVQIVDGELSELS